MGHCMSGQQEWPAKAAMPKQANLRGVEQRGEQGVALGEDVHGGGRAVGPLQAQPGRLRRKAHRRRQRAQSAPLRHLP